MIMAGKLDKEREAIAAAERELVERRYRLAEMEHEEQEKELQRLVKKLTVEAAIEILTRSVNLKPKAALEALQAAGEKAASKPQSEKALEPA
jgi:ketopantoate reductase